MENLMKAIGYQQSLTIDDPRSLLEKAAMLQAGYAIEYDHVDPRALDTARASSMVSVSARQALPA